MIVSESHLEGKAPGQKCLDEIVITERWVAVVDQSTPKSESEPNLVAVVRQRIESLDAAASWPPAALVNWINEGVARVQENAQYRPCTTIAVVDAKDRNVIRVGDCHVMIDDDAHEGVNPVDAVLGPARSLVTEILKYESPNVEALVHGRNEILGWLRRAGAVLRNHPTSPFGFGALDGAPIPGRFVESFPVPAGARRVAIMTDGYPVPRLDLAEAENELARLLRADPGMLSAAATKGVPPGGVSFDDRAFVSVVLGNSD
jgi:hypothetical protein